MNLELYRAALEQRLSSRLRIALALFVNFVSGFGLNGFLPYGFVAPALTAYVVTAGILGKEFSAGTPQLTFARPVTRSSYVLSRWAACVTVMLAFNVVAIVLGLWISHASHAPGPSAARLLVAEIAGIGTCAVVVGFSALSNGFADVVLIAAWGVAMGVLNAVASQVHDPDLGHGLATAADTLYRWVFPDPLHDVTLLVSGVDVASAATFVAASAFWLLVAVVALGRREVTYATD